jgi:DNA uptake protein ComE-like DNA-binding protein
MSDMQCIPGIGPSKAADVVQYRERHPFNDANSLQSIGKPTGWDWDDVEYMLYF